MERADELKERIRQQPLNDRLEESRRRIGDMCSKGRCPKMTIPVQHDDDDFYINTTLADAQATIAALEETILKMGENAAVVAKDAMAAKEQVAALQADNRTYINERHENMKQIEQLQAMNNRLGVRVETLESQLTQRTAERDTARRRVDELEAREVDVVLLREDLEKRAAELEAAKGKLDIILRVSRGEPDDELAVDYGGLGWENDPAVLGVYNLTAELERVRGELDDMQRAAQGMSNDLTGIGQKYDELRTLIAALPKVEYEIKASNFIAHIWPDHDTEEPLVDLRASVAALLKHRQGMEG